MVLNKAHFVGYHPYQLQYQPHSARKSLQPFLSQKKTRKPKFLRNSHISKRFFNFFLSLSFSSSPSLSSSPSPSTVFPLQSALDLQSKKSRRLREGESENQEISAYKSKPQSKCEYIIQTGIHLFQ